MIEDPIGWIHDILGLIHCVIMSIMSLYLLPTYIQEPLGTLSSDTFEFVRYFLQGSIGYFIFGTIVTLFFEPYGKQTIQYLIHHALTISVPLVVVMTQQYSNIAASFYLAEISSIMLNIRSISKRLHIKGNISLVIDALFAISFVLSRFTVLQYMIYKFLLGFLQHYHNWSYLFMIFVTMLGNCLNLVWLCEIFRMIIRKLTPKKDSATKIDIDD